MHLGNKNRLKQSFASFVSIVLHISTKKEKKVVVTIISYEALKNLELNAQRVNNKLYLTNKIKTKLEKRLSFRLIVI